MTGMLVMVPSVHVMMRDGQMWMDDKFVAGLHLFAREWGGPTRVVLRQGSATLPFASPVTAADLPGELRLIAQDAPISAEDLPGAQVVLGTADDHRQLDLARLCGAVGGAAGLCDRIPAADPPGRRAAGPGAPPVASGPVGPVAADAGVAAAPCASVRARGAGQRLSRDGGLWGAERRHMPLSGQSVGAGDHGHGFRNAGPRGVERAAADRPCRPADRDERYAGLDPTAITLRDRGVDFRMDIFGAGDMRQAIADDMARHDLGGAVHLHPPVDFATGLVPWMRQHAELFLAPHRQADPSCSYLEAMGCGVPVLGTDNRIWSELARQSGGGWVMPTGQPRKTADIIAGLDRAAIARASAHALKFALAHEFHSEFRCRVDHLHRVAVKSA